MDEVEQDIVDKVDEFGWMVIAVAPRPGTDDPEEWFAYTVGLTTTFGWPELICFGLEPAVVKTILNNAVKECRSCLRQPHAGMVLRDVAEGFAVRLVETGEWQRNYTNWARWYAIQAGSLREHVDCLQLIWPDNYGVFPDDAACSEVVLELQTPMEMAS